MLDKPPAFTAAVLHTLCDHVCEGVDAESEQPSSRIGEAKPDHDDSSSGIVPTTSLPDGVSRLVSDRLGSCIAARFHKLLGASFWMQLLGWCSPLCACVIFQS